MIFQYTHYPADHKTQFFTHFSKKKKIYNYWLFQRVAYDTSFGYFHVWEKFGIKRVNQDPNIDAAHQQLFELYCIISGFKAKTERSDFS